MAKHAVKSYGVRSSKMPRIAHGGDELIRALGIDDDLRTEGDLYTALSRHRAQYWHEVVAAYECRPRDLYNAWHYLNNHPIYYRFESYGSSEGVEHERNLVHGQGIDIISIEVVRVNPTNGRIEDDPVLNTETAVWFEGGPWLWQSDCVAAGDSDIGFAGIKLHDLDMDGGAQTIEKAIIKLARKVHARYRNDRQRIKF